MTQGLGQQQLKQIKFTQSKIAAFLAVRPFTAEGLLKESSIRRNGFRNKLDTLVSRKIVIKHKYNIIKKQSQNSKNNNLRYGDTYYLLNLDNPESKALVEYYYDNPITITGKKKNDNPNEISNKTIKLTKEQKHEVKRQNKIIETCMREFVNLEKQMEPELQRRKDLILKWAMCIEILRNRFDQYDDYENSLYITDDDGNKNKPDINLGLPTWTIAETLVKVFLQNDIHNIWSLSEYELKDFIYNSLPQKYQFLTDADYKKQRELLKTYSNSKLQHDFEELIDFDILVTRKLRLVKLAMVNRQIRSKPLTQQYPDSYIQNIKTVAKTLLEQGYNIYDILIMLSASENRSSLYDPDKLIIVVGLIDYQKLWNIIIKLSPQKKKAQSV